MCFSTSGTNGQREPGLPVDSDGARTVAHRPTCPSSLQGAAESRAGRMVVPEIKAEWTLARAHTYTHPHTQWWCETHHGQTGTIWATKCMKSSWLISQSVKHPRIYTDTEELHRWRRVSRSENPTSCAQPLGPRRLEPDPHSHEELRSDFFRRGRCGKGEMLSVQL